MKTPQKAYEIMKALVERFGKQISVSCKIRVLRTYEETLEYVMLMQSAGIHWISIHPRTAAEETRVPARWYTVKKMLDTGLVKIPVLGSGDLFSPLDVHKYLSYTKAHGCILARGAIHNPGIFKHKEALLNRDRPLVDDMSGTEEDWKESIVEPVLDEEQKIIQDKEMDLKEQ